MKRLISSLLLGSFILATPVIALADGNTPCPTTSQQLFWEVYQPPGWTDYVVVMRWNVVVVGSPRLDLSLSGNTLHVQLAGGTFGVLPGPMPAQAFGVISPVPAGRYVVQIDPYSSVLVPGFPPSTTCPAPFPIPLDVPTGTPSVATPVDSLSKLGLLLLGGLLAISGLAVRLRRTRHG